jgi:hypothetical protein
MPESKSKKIVRGTSDLSIMAYQGSNCYMIRRPDGTIYYMPPGCS